jgi:phytoene dehydrogenase-like protein
MANEFDAIVIGAGVSGLSVAALLTKAGKRVLVLERMNQVGGRATSFKQVIGGKEVVGDIGGPHSMTMGDRGAFASVYRELGFSPEKFGESVVPPQPGFLIYRHGRWDDLVQLNKGENREDFKKIVNDVVALNYDDIDQWDTMSFRKWITDRTSREDVQDWFRAIGHVFTSIPDYEEMSAGECVYTMKLNLEGMHSVSSGSFAKGGSITLSLPLADYIKQQGDWDPS